MNKQISNAFGKDVYLLGKDKNGTSYWLAAASWDCDWYYGLGYVESYTNNNNPSWARDLSQHLHFDNLFLNTDTNCFNAFKRFFVETPLTDNEIYRLMELMQSLYTCRAYSDMMYVGGSHISTVKETVEIIKNRDEYNRINKVMIPALCEQVYNLLSK